MKKLLPIANGIALLATIVINYLSNTGIFNGNTMATVSARYHNPFTPAAYAFSIWGLIYLGLLAFVIDQGRSLFKKKPVEWTAKDKGTKSATKGEEDTVLQIGGWFILSCIANCGWVLAWLYDYTGLSVLIMLILFSSLLKIILNTRMELDDVPLKTIAFTWWPFCLYSGWIAVALIANLAAWLTKIKWNGWGIPAVDWAIIMIVVAGAINLFMTWNRNMREFASVGVWALVAIAVPNWRTAPSIAWAAVVMAIIVFINIGIHAFKNRNFSPWTYNARHSRVNNP